MAKSNLIIVSFDQSDIVNCSQIAAYSKLDRRFPTKGNTHMHTHNHPLTQHSDGGPNICDISNKPRYRLRPNYKCYSYDPDEDFMRCRSGPPISASATLLIFLLITPPLLRKGLLLINELYL